MVLVEQDVVQALKAAQRVYACKKAASRFRRSGGADARANRRGVFWSLNRGLDQRHSPGVLVGGLYAMFAAGLSLISASCARQYRARRSHRARAYLALVTTRNARHRAADVADRGRAADALIGYALQRLVLNRTLGEDLLPPLLVTFGLSVIIQNGLLSLFTPTA